MKSTSKKLSNTPHRRAAVGARDRVAETPRQHEAWSHHTRRPQAQRPSPSKLAHNPARLSDALPLLREKCGRHGVDAVLALPLSLEGGVWLHIQVSQINP